MSVLTLAFTVHASTAPSPTEVEVFTRPGCVYCQKAKDFLATIAPGYPDVRFVYRDITVDPNALAKLQELAREAGNQQLALPTFYIGGILLVGFDGPSGMGARLRQVLDEGLSEDGNRSITLPGFGEVALESYGLAGFTVVLGLVDGFNPCAMWVLLFLLSLLVHVKSRARMLLIAGTFVVVSGVVYFGFMAAWLNILLLIGVSAALRVILGALAIAVGGINIKDFFAFKQGLSLSIPDSAKPGIYRRVNRILHAENLTGALAGVITLAVLVNFVELLCTAGLPALYTQILSAQPLSRIGYYVYLLLYNLAYMFDDGLMVGAAVWTLSVTRLQETGGRWLKLLSGVVMALIGLLLIFAPDWLALGG